MTKLHKQIDFMPEVLTGFWARDKILDNNLNVRRKRPEVTYNVLSTQNIKVKHCTTKLRETADPLKQVWPRGKICHYYDQKLHSGIIKCMKTHTNQMKEFKIEQPQARNGKLRTVRMWSLLHKIERHTSPTYHLKGWEGCVW